MANYLGLTWDNAGLHLLEGWIKGVSVGWGRGIHLPVAFNPKAAEATGQQLKQAMKDAGLKPGTLIACVGRERLLTKELRYPTVDPHELPSLIQFQTYKDLTLPPDEAVIDFYTVNVPWPGGENRAVAVIARKSELEAYAKLSSAAGLKLEAVIPHSFSVFANALTFIPPGQTATGIIADGEFLVVKSHDIIYSRSLDLDDKLSREVKRNVAAYQSLMPQHPLQEIYLAGSELAPELEQLVETIHKPIRWYDPFSGMTLALPGSTSVWLPAAGAIQAKQIWPVWPINFAAPKKDVPKPNRKRFYAIVGGSIAAGIGLLGGGFYLMNVLEKQARITEKQNEISQLKTDVASFGNLEERVADIRKWQQQDVILLDEIYDLSAWFPDVSGIRIINAHWATIAQTAMTGMGPRMPQATKPTPFSSTSPGQKAISGPSNVAKPVAELTLIIQAESVDKLLTLRKELERERNWKMDSWRVDLQNDKLVTAKLKVFPRQPDDYRSVITQGKLVTQPGEIKPESTRSRLTNPRNNRGGRP